MKTIELNFFNSDKFRRRELKKLKSQIQAIAKIAHKTCPTRYYLQYLQFEKIEQGIRISATNGTILSDLVIPNIPNNLKTGDKFWLEAKPFLKLEYANQIEIEEDKATLKILGLSSKNIPMLKGDIYPDVDRVRIKHEPKFSFGINLKQLKLLVDSMEDERFKISFDEEIGKPILITSYKGSSGVLMPIRF